MMSLNWMKKANMKTLLKFTPTVLCFWICFGCTQHNKPVLEKIVGHDAIELSKIKTISIEWEKSTPSDTDYLLYLTYSPLKQYTNKNDIEVYIPLDGVIERIIQQDAISSLKNAILVIQSKQIEGLFVELYNVDINSDEWGEGKVVKAGMHFGYVHSSEESNSISVRVIYQTENTVYKYLLTSIMPDYVFSHYQRRGINSQKSLEDHFARISNEPEGSGSINLFLDEI